MLIKPNFKTECGLVISFEGLFYNKTLMDHDILILGDAGTGKSYLFEYLANMLEYELVILRRGLPKLVDDKNYLFDGLDEISKEDLDNLSEFLKSSRGHNIFSSRIVGYEEVLPKDGLVKFNIHELTPSQQRDIIKESLARYPDLIDLTVNCSFNELMDTPLKLKMLCDHVASRGHLPDNLTELYASLYTRFICYLESDLAHNIGYAYNVDGEMNALRTEEMFKVIAEDNQRNDTQRKIIITESKLLEYYKDEVPSGMHFDDFLFSIDEVSYLFFKVGVMNGESIYQFEHLSMQEYIASIDEELTIDLCKDFRQDQVLMHVINRTRKRALIPFYNKHKNELTERNKELFKNRLGDLI